MRLDAEGKNVEAVRRCREITGIGLKEAKEYVDGLGKEKGDQSEREAYLILLKSQYLYSVFNKNKRESDASNSLRCSPKTTTAIQCVNYIINI